jgi:CBS domain-containing protein
MIVSEFMTHNPVTIGRNATISDALETMAGAGCHHLPVLDTEGHLIGIISDCDLYRALEKTARAAAGDGSEARYDVSPTPILAVHDVMTPAPIVIEPNASAGDAARLMLSHHIHCLPVLRGETLLGIITCSDLLITFMNLTQRK